MPNTSNTQFINFGRALFTAPVAPADTTVDVDDGSVFPPISGPEYFYAVFEKIVAGQPVSEVVIVTDVTGNTLTVTRAVGGTTAETFSTNDTVENRVTMGTLDEFANQIELNKVGAGSNTLQYNDGAGGFEGDISLQWDPVIGQLLVGPGGVGDPIVRIDADATGDPKLFFSQSAVDAAIIQYLNTTGELRVEGNNSVRIYPNNTAGAFFDATGLDLREGGYRLEERADHAFPLDATKGEIWMRSSDQKLIYTDPAGTDYDLTLATPPGGVNGNVQYNDGGAFGGVAAFNWDGVDLTVDGRLVLASATSQLPTVRFSATGEGVDEKNWDINLWDDEFSIRKLDDAFANPLYILNVSRGTGNTVDSIEIGADVDTTELQAISNVVLNPGGYIQLATETRLDGGSLYIEEAAAASANIAAFGQLWVRNDSPNRLIFTDDTGVDYDLAAMASAVGPQYAIQYADPAGVFNGNANFTFDTALNVFTVGDGSDQMQWQTDQLLLYVGGNIFGEWLQGEMTLRDSTVADPTAFDTIDSRFAFESQDGNLFGEFGYLDGGADAFEIRNFAYDADFILRVTDGASTNTDYGLTFNSQAWAVDLDVDGSAETIYDIDTSSKTTVQEVDFFHYSPTTHDFGLIIAETADHPRTPVASFGQLWVRDDVPNVLVFTDDAGNDIVLTPSGGFGDVFKVGTPVDNQIGVWTGDGTIEGNPNFLWDGATQTITSSTNDFALDINSNVAGRTASILQISEDDATATAGAYLIELVNAGLATSLAIRHTGGNVSAGIARIDIDASSGMTDGSALKIENADAGFTGEMIEINLQNASALGQGLYVRNAQASTTYSAFFTDNTALQLGVTQGGTLYFRERADHERVPAAGLGELWVRDDSPNKLIYTDDAGNDYDLTVQGIWTESGTNLYGGSGAGASLTTGVQNILAGFNAGNAITDGEQNTFIGILAGGAIVGGDNNVGIGNNTLDNTASANRNTAIGRNAGSNVITTSSDNIFLGYNSGPPTSLVNNRLYIDVVTTDTPFIGGDMSTGGVELAGTIRFTERADHIQTPTATFGEIWVRDDAPNKLIFTDDAGTDYDLTDTGGNISGSIADNQIAVGAVTADEIEGSANLTWDGTDLSVNGNIVIAAPSGTLQFSDPLDASILNANGETAISFSQNGNTQLYYNNASKFETISDGVQVQGDMRLDDRIERFGSGEFFIDHVQQGAGNHLTLRAETTDTGVLQKGLRVQVDTVANGISAILYHGDVDVAQTISAATGGLQVNNTLTGAGFERVLTTSDIGAGAIGGSISNNQVAIGAATADEIEGQAYWVYENITKVMTFGDGVTAGTPTMEINGTAAGDSKLVLQQGGFDRAVAEFLDFQEIFRLDVRPIAGILRLAVNGTGQFDVEFDTNTSYNKLDMNDGGIRFQERADHAFTPAAGKGEIWTRDDAPNCLIFTDDTGEDFKLNSVFGTEFESGESLGQQSTTSSTYVTAFTHTTASLPAGDYLIEWSMDAGAKSDKEVSHRVQLDGADISESEWRFKEGTAKTGEAWQALAGHVVATLTAGTHTIDFEYNANDIAYIRRMRVNLYRVA